MSTSDGNKYCNFSSETESYTGNPNKNPFIFPCIMLGTAAVLGGALLAVDMEGRLVHLFPNANPSKTASLLTAMGGVSITAAHGHAMMVLGNARRKFQIPHPTVAAQSNIPFWNANRGYYNLVEHMPFFLFNVWLAREAGAPCIAGASCVVYGIGRLLYTHGYAYGGPMARKRGFMLATAASMSCLGVALIKSSLSLFAEG